MLTIMEIVVRNSVWPETTTLGITHAIRMEIKYAYLVGEESAVIQVLNFQLYGCMSSSINIFIASTLPAVPAFVLLSEEEIRMFFVWSPPRSLFPFRTRSLPCDHW